MSHAVVMLTADGNVLTALSVMLAMFCVPPEFTVTVSDVLLTALSVTLSVFEVRPAWAEAVAAKMVSAVAEAERVRSRIIQPLPGEGEKDAAFCVGLYVPELTNRTDPYAPPARLTNDPCRRHLMRQCRHLRHRRPFAWAVPAKSVRTCVKPRSWREQSVEESDSTTTSAFPLQTSIMS